MIFHHISSHFKNFFLLPFALAIFLALSMSARAQLFETQAKQAVLLDVATGSILFGKEPDTQIPPASLAKLMTIEVVFNALKSGRLTMDDEFLVSENAWRNGGAGSGGSTMFAKLKSSIRLEDLIQGIIVQSANDGCIIVAEGMAGSEDLFAKLMTERARKIGLTNSVFYNATGLPHPDQKVTMADLVKLALHLQTEYPEYYHYYSQDAFTWNKIRQRNRNPLLSMDIGADGMKTGFTEASGYAIVGSINKDGRRLIVAMSGLESERQRAEEARKILQWGLRAFEPYSLFKADQVVGAARLYGGAQFSVAVAPKQDVTILVPLTNEDRLRAKVSYLGPINTPVHKGDQIANLEISIGDQITKIEPLYAAEDVAKGPIHRQALDAISELVMSQF